MRNEQSHRLDDRAVEQLLQGEPDTTAAELRALSVVLRTAAAAPDAAGDPSPTVGEEAAVEAYRAAWDGLPRPDASSGRQRLSGPLKAGIGALASALLFGGVAVAAQAGVIHPRFPGLHGSGPGGRTRVSTSASPHAGATPGDGQAPRGVGSLDDAAAGSADPGTPSATDPAADPAADQATGSLRSLCAARRSEEQTPGGPHSSAALRSLIRAAGSEEAVPVYCAQLLGSAGTEAAGAIRGASAPSSSTTPGSSAAGKAVTSSAPSRQTK